MIFRKLQRYLKTVGLLGMLFAVRAFVTKATVLFKVNWRGIKFPFYLRIISSDVIACEQIFVQEEYDFRVRVPPKIIVDAGANIGLASIYFANQYPEAKIIAIEPEKNNFELLKKNVAPYPNIFPVHAALWHRNEEINLIDPGMGEWGFMTTGAETPTGPAARFSHKVRAVTMDHLLAEFSFDHVDILKMDIEGAEKEVFEDPSSWLGRVDALIVELHENWKPGCHRNFYNATNGFDHEWKQGENVFLTRGENLTRRTPADH